MSDENTILLRRLVLDDYLDLSNSMREAYAGLEGALWSREQIESLLARFPEGQFCILVNERVVGCALSLIVDYERFGDDHCYREITGDYQFHTHDPGGDTLYGIDVFLHPANRGMRLGRRLYDARKQLCEDLNLKSIIFGGRIPNYTKHADAMSPKEYLAKVRQREIHDPVLNFQMANDFHPRKVLTGYSEGDTESHEYAVLLEWNNVCYTRPRKGQQLSTKTVVRVGAVQWQMRHFADVDALCGQMEFFVNAIAGYRSDFVLFPELFNAPLMAEMDHLPEAQAIRWLAGHTERLRRAFSELAIKYNTNIITGSMPLETADGTLLNVGFLCRRDGSWERYDKLHITPNEATAWGMRGGNTLKAFDTDCGKIGILICYDVEFPELSRLLTEQGMNILFVPFLTDTQNGYTRVRCCAQARAIENECFVVLAGSVGNLPRVSNMDIQFAQSAVFTPSDFAFPTNGIKAEATPNTEAVLIADVDIKLLRELHEFGTVRILKDRRGDLYQIHTAPGFMD